MGEYRMGERVSIEDDEIRDAYECGYKEGYGDAMSEVEGRYGERRSGMGMRESMGMRNRPGMGMRRGSMGMRDDVQEYPEQEMMGERRSRDSRGRYM